MLKLHGWIFGLMVGTDCKYVLSADSQMFPSRINKLVSNFKHMGTFTVTFGKLNDEKLDFIRERISVNKCEVCNEKASLKITEENVHVINICCGRFAEIIGASLTLRTINNHAIEFRGKFLNDFCVLENFIDAIIELHGFIYNLTPQEFFKKEIKEINTRERKELFKLCLDRYTELTKTKYKQNLG